MKTTIWINHTCSLVNGTQNKYELITECRGIKKRKVDI